MPSKEAMELANEVASVAYGFEYTKAEMKELAQRLDAALAKARLEQDELWRSVAQRRGKSMMPEMLSMANAYRLEGAKAMQAKTTEYLENCPKPKACYIRALDPQQVINESIRK